jgi:hypothetical protein
MCYPIRCPDCGKTGWTGCGQHVGDVMATVPLAQRCRCRTGFSRGQDREEQLRDPGTRSR